MGFVVTRWFVVCEKILFPRIPVVLSVILHAMRPVSSLWQPSSARGAVDLVAVCSFGNLLTLLADMRGAVVVVSLHVCTLMTLAVCVVVDG